MSRDSSGVLQQAASLLGLSVTKRAMTGELDGCYVRVNYSPGSSGTTMYGGGSSSPQVSFMVSRALVGAQPTFSVRRRHLRWLFPGSFASADPAWSKRFVVKVVKASDEDAVRDFLTAERRQVFDDIEAHLGGFRYAQFGGAVDHELSRRTGVLRRGPIQSTLSTSRSSTTRIANTVRALTGYVNAIASGRSHREDRRPDPSL